MKEVFDSYWVFMVVKDILKIYRVVIYVDNIIFVRILENSEERILVLIE